MPLNEWVNINGVKCVDISNLSGAWFSGTYTPATDHAPLFGLEVDNRAYVFESGLSVWEHRWSRGASDEANYSITFPMGDVNGVEATSTTKLAFMKIDDHKIIMIATQTNSLNDTVYQRSDEFDTNDTQSFTFRVVPCYVKLGAPYTRDDWGYSLIRKEIAKDGSAAYSTYSYLPGAPVSSYTWAGFTINNNIEVNKEKRNDTPQGGDRGGDGNQSNPRVNINTPALPNIDMSASGIFLYGLSSAEMKSFTQYLWTSDWGEVIKKIRSDPMQNVISLGLIDLNLNRTPTNIVLGNVETQCSAGVVNSFIEIDCGSIKLDEYYATFADYEPNVSLSLYLPKLGFVGIPAGVLVNNTLRIVYHIELSSGNGIIYLLLTNTRNDITYIYKTYSCQCVSFLPLTASDHTQQALTYINSISNLTRSVMSGSPTAIAGSALSGMVSNLTAREQTEVDGTLSGMSSLMSYKTPYLIINANYVIKPKNFGDENGYCLYTTNKISNMSGYVQTLNYTPSFSAPESVLNEITSLMNDGVYV